MVLAFHLTFDNPLTEPHVRHIFNFENIFITLDENVVNVIPFERLSPWALREDPVNSVCSRFAERLWLAASKDSLDSFLYARKRVNFDLLTRDVQPLLLLHLFEYQKFRMVQLKSLPHLPEGLQLLNYNTTGS